MANRGAPLSPHLQIWRFTATMATSILQRIAGGAMYAGSILLTAWLAAAAAGDKMYAQVQGLFASPIGTIVLVLFSWAISYHLLNGLRYLFWDAGHGFEKETAERTAWGALIGSVVLTAVIWVAVGQLKGA